jgi:hypothetical protein
MHKVEKLFQEIRSELTNDPYVQSQNRLKNAIKLVLRDVLMTDPERGDLQAAIIKAMEETESLEMDKSQIRNIINTLLRMDSSTEETDSNTEETDSSTEETDSNTEETDSSTEETDSNTEETDSSTEETDSSTEETEVHYLIGVINLLSLKLCNLLTDAFNKAHQYDFLSLQNPIIESTQLAQNCQKWLDIMLPLFGLPVLINNKPTEERAAEYRKHGETIESTSDLVEFLIEFCLITFQVSDKQLTDQKLLTGKSMVKKTMGFFSYGRQLFNRPAVPTIDNTESLYPYLDVAHVNQAIIPLVIQKIQMIPNIIKYPEQFTCLYKGLVLCFQSRIRDLHSIHMQECIQLVQDTCKLYTALDCLLTTGNVGAFSHTAADPQMACRLIVAEMCRATVDDMSISSLQSSIIVPSAQ